MGRLFCKREGKGRGRRARILQMSAWLARGEGGGAVGSGCGGRGAVGASGHGVGGGGAEGRRGAAGVGGVGGRRAVLLLCRERAAQRLVHRAPGRPPRWSGHLRDSTLRPHLLIHRQSKRGGMSPQRRGCKGGDIHPGQPLVPSCSALSLRQLPHCDRRAGRTQTAGHAAWSLASSGIAAGGGRREVTAGAPGGTKLTAREKPR